MKKSYKYLMAALLVGCCCFWSLSTNASVCFLPSGECGDGSVNPDDIIPDANELEQKCKEAGYTVKRTECVTPKHIGDYCPYDNNWVLCCDAEYTSQCDSTNIILDRCGNLLKCGCPDEFDYYESGDNCTRLSNGTSYENARGDYANGICYFRQYKNDALVTTSLYKGCLCNPVTYPRTVEICQAKGMKAGGIRCQDAPDGDEHFTKCECNETILKTTCSYGVPGSATTCTDEDGLQYVSDCCQCDATTYPYTELPSEVVNYVKCRTEKGCTGGNSERYRATSCKSGYTVVNGKCTKDTCSGAIKELLKATNDTQYGVLTATTVVDGNGNTSTATKAIVADSVTISTAGSNSSSSSSHTTTVCIRRECKDNVTPRENPFYQDDDSCVCTNCGVWQHHDLGSEWTFSHIGPIPCQYLDQPYSNLTRYGCARGNGGGGREMLAVCTHTRDITTTNTTTGYAGLVGSKAKTYISAAQYLETFGDDPIADNAKNNCSGTPVITYTASTFPSNDSQANTDPLNFKGIELRFPQSTSSYRALTVDNGILTVSGTLWNYGTLTLTGTGEVNISGELVNRNRFLSSGYSFNSESSYFGRGTLTDISSKDVTNSITLGEGQVFAVNKFQIGNERDTYQNRYNWTIKDAETGKSCSDKDHLPSASLVNKTFRFYGPSSSSPASVYTNLQVGWAQGAYRARGLTLNLSNALDWYLYNPNNSAQYTIGLTTGSKIQVTDNSARILEGRNKILKKCSMVDKVDYQRHNHVRLLRCGCNGNRDAHIYDSQAYMACTYTVSGNKGYLRSVDYTSKKQVCTSGTNCGDRQTYVNNLCEMTYQSCNHDNRSTVQLMTCE